MVFDAGSTGTRLFVYHKESGGWKEEKKERQAGALADPVRNKTWNEDEATKVAKTIAALLKADPGRYDWKAKCEIESVSVLATAGMRIAEQQNKDNARRMYEIVKDEIVEELGGAVPRERVESRTLTGFEEGLFAWLAHTGAKSSTVGLVELGGASAQVVFPCPSCAEAKLVVLADKEVKIFSHSFLGLGMDEAHKRIEEPTLSACKRGADKLEGCRIETKKLFNKVNEKGIRDPLNYQGRGQGPLVTLPRTYFPKEWHFAGGLNFLNKPKKGGEADTATDCCTNCELVKGDTNFSYCTHSVASCFNAVYSETFVEALTGAGFDEERRTQASWTLGAVLCAETDCTQKLELPCRWLPDHKCLDRLEPPVPSRSE